MKKLEILKYTRKKVKKLFEENPVPAHGFDHIERVRNFALKIAKSEKCDIFLSEMAAWLHDIGRTQEKIPSATRAHHELSYILCREWFRNDSVLNNLSKKEKIILLYSVRYHWNDAADKYKVAIVLRDADKLDALGKMGVARNIEFFKGNEEGLMNQVRFFPDIINNLKTKIAIHIAGEKKLIKPVLKFQKSFLKSKIRPVEL